VELFPFSFAEYLTYFNVPHEVARAHGTEERALIAHHFNHFAHLGGFPVYLQEGNDEFLTGLYQSILYRDVLVRNRLTNEKELLEMVYFLASNIAKSTTYGALCRVAGVKNPTTIRNYMGFLENTYLLFQVSKFDYALRKQLHNPKKVYFIDNGLVRKVGFQFTEEKGRLLENLVFVELKRRRCEVFYHLGKKECDFVIRQGIRIIQAIQVCDRVEDRDTHEREIAGLTEAMESYDLREGWLLVRDGMPVEINVSGARRIYQVPVWKWLLEGSGKDDWKP
jgi:predicted AAA+ superfamily ATPase